jgi:hypothetical protein
MNNNSRHWTTQPPSKALEQLNLIPYRMDNISIHIFHFGAFQITWATAFGLESKL